MSIGAIYGGVNPVSAWEYHKELKPTPAGGAVSVGDAPSTEAGMAQMVAIPLQGAAAAAPPPEGSDIGRMDGQSHPMRALQAFSPWNDRPIITGDASPETPKDSINELIAKTASTG